MLPLNDEILQVSAKYLGLTEEPGGRSNPTIVQWLNAVGRNTDDEDAWCGAAMNGILSECGIRGTGSALARSFLLWGVSTWPNPEPGDIVIFSGKELWQGHVGIHIQWSGAKRLYELVRGGNQRDKYCELWWSPKRILDTRRAA